MTDQPVTPAPKRKKKKESNSRPARWARACASASTAIGKMEEALGELQGALEDLNGVREEYEEWRDNLPENLQGSALYEKLDEVCNLDVENAGSEIESAIETARSTVDDAEGVDLPRGFGRD